MKSLITICSLIAALCLAWQHHSLSEAKEDAELRAADTSRHLGAAREELKIANTRIAELSAPHPAPGPTPKPNWVEERNRNWQSSLSNGASDNRRVVTPPVIYSVPTPTYYTDSRGRYWVDSFGARHYTQ